MNWIITFFTGVIVIGVIIGRKQKAARKHYENICDIQLQQAKSEEKQR